MRLVLASSSARRLQLVERLGVVPARVLSPEIDETPRKGERPDRYALRMAEEKALAVSRADDEVVLAGDTSIALGRTVLPPADSEGLQRDLLRRLSGRRHHALSAVAVIDTTGTLRTRLSDTIVAFRPLTEAEIDAYVESREGLGKAGGYAIQGRAEGFVRRIDGSHSGVVGLPLFETRALLKAAGLPLG